MSPSIAVVLGILLVAMVLLITERLRVDVVALLVLATLAVTGILSPAEALAGFSNPAVVTVWAMFILSAALTETGVADLLGTRILRLAGTGEARMIAVVMLTAGLLSAFMNNIGVAALLLPAVLAVARRSGRPPSRLLMPLAYGCLLGGLTTLVGTPPNLLVAETLRERGMAPFRLFDFTPIGLPVLLVGTAFVALVGRHLLPRRDPGRELPRGGPGVLTDQYQLRDRSAVLRLPDRSPLEGMTLEDSRLGSATGLNVYAILRGAEVQVAPGPRTVLRSGDRLVVEGALDRFQRLQGWRELKIEDGETDPSGLTSADMTLVELRLPEGSSFIGSSLSQLNFRERFGAIVLALRRGKTPTHSGLADRPLLAEDRLLVMGTSSSVTRLTGREEFTIHRVDPAAAVRGFGLTGCLFTVRLPPSSILVGESVVGSRLGDALGLGVLCLVRGADTRLMPGAEERLEAADRLLVRGAREALDVFRGLQGLVLESDTLGEAPRLESADTRLMEAMLAPRSAWAGQTLRQLGFRERFGVQVMAVLRQGAALRTELRDLPLRLGDALLLLGPRERLEHLSREPALLLIEPGEHTPRQVGRRPIALLITAAVVVPVLLGWLPISIAAVAGAALMIVTGCLGMDDAYRAIDWRSVFLIAGLLPLGTAMQESGAASLVAGWIFRDAASWAPWAVLAALYATTALATSVVPTSALVVLIAPIAFQACSATGISPRAALMAIAMAASASFTSPVSHPANVLVMGFGGYRFIDYVKLGVPLTLVVALVVFALLPLFWPAGV